MERIDRTDTGSGWLVHTEDGDRAASRVVMATGDSHMPRHPTWPGGETFTGDLRHSADYREPSAYAGKHVLVVGAGNSATEIALNLLVPAPGSPCRFHAAQHRATRHPRRPEPGLRHRDEAGAGAPGRIPVVAATEWVDGPAVHLADGATRPTGRRGRGRTGFTTGLEPVVGHLDGLDRRGVPLVHGADDLPSARGLHFVGIKAELSGLLREIGLEARAVGRALATAG